MLLDIGYLKEKYKIQSKGIAHVGAHLGQEIAEYTKHFSDAEIHLFEPQKNIFSDLKNKYCNLNNIYFYNVALGNQEGKVRLHNASNDGQSSSILEPRIHLEIHPQVKFKSTQEVQITTFDSFKLDNVNFLNIDTQGYELNVLLGSKKSLINKIDYIICEVNKIEVYKDCPLVNEIDAYLNQFGFIRTDTHYWQDKYPWGDAFYIQRKHLRIGKILLSKIKNYLYSFKFFYPFLIKVRNFYWNLMG